MRSPIVSREKLAPSVVLYKASAAAIFMGCWVSIWRACVSPMKQVPSAESSVTTMAILATVMKVSFCWSRRMCHAAMASMKTAPVRRAAKSTWKYAPKNVELVMTAQKSVITAWPVALSILKPTGCCIHEFAARINTAESIVPTLASQIDAKCTRLLTRPRPKIQIPRNVDSMKKASRPSIARGAPKILPTKTE